MKKIIALLLCLVLAAVSLAVFAEGESNLQDSPYFASETSRRKIKINKIYYISRAKRAGEIIPNSALRIPN